MRCRYCKGELIHHYASAYKCGSCGKVFEMFEEESFEDLKNQIEREKEMNHYDPYTKRHRRS